jgi:hypothetical protein
MSLRNVFADFLNLSEPAAAGFMELMVLDKQWQRSPEWKGEKINPATIATQADLIKWAQAAAQTAWFQKHDRSAYLPTEAAEKLKEAYFKEFTAVGLTAEVKCEEKPHYSVVLGSSESQVKGRVATLQADLKKGIAPEKKHIIGLGTSSRPLNVSVAANSENESLNALKAQGIENPTEMEMVNLITEKMLTENFSTSELKLNYVGLNTFNATKSRAEASCVTTSDTAKKLSEYIKSEIDFKETSSPVKVRVYSQQPFVLRQQRDVESMGENFEVKGVGAALSKEEFMANPLAIAICLGEAARLLNTEYTRELQLGRKKWEVALTPVQLAELQALQQPSISTKPVLAAESVDTHAVSDSKINNKGKTSFASLSITLPATTSAVSSSTATLFHPLNSRGRSQSWPAASKQVLPPPSSTSSPKSNGR